MKIGDRIITLHCLTLRDAETYIPVSEWLDTIPLGVALHASWSQEHGGKVRSMYEIWTLVAPGIWRATLSRN